MTDALYVIPMLKDGSELRFDAMGRDLRQSDIGHHRLVKPEPAHDGGMIEFFDPYTGKPVGCCGINFWKKYALPVTIGNS